MTQKVFNNMQEVYEHCKKDIFERVKIRFRSQEIAEDISSDIFAEIAAHCDWFIKQDGNRQSEYLFHIYMKVIEKYEEKEFNEKLVAYKEATYDELLANEDRLVFMEEDAVRSNFFVLSDAEKIVAEKRFIGNKSIKQIAKEEKTTENAVSQRLLRAKNKMKKEGKFHG